MISIMVYGAALKTYLPEKMADSELLWLQSNGKYLLHGEATAA